MLIISSCFLEGEGDAVGFAEFGPPHFAVSSFVYAHPLYRRRQCVQLRCQVEVTL